MKMFGVETETTLVENYGFPKQSSQEKKAVENNITRVFRFRDIHGNVSALPQYIKKSIVASGFEAVYLGGTTYSHAMIGLKKSGLL